MFAYAEILPKMVNPRDIYLEEQKRRFVATNLATAWIVASALRAGAKGSSLASPS